LRRLHTLKQESKPTFIMTSNPMPPTPMHSEAPFLQNTCVNHKFAWKPKACDASHLCKMCQHASAFVRLLPLVLEHLAQHLSMRDVRVLSSVSRTTTFLLLDENWLHYVLRYVQPMNAQNTRWVFFLPQWIALKRLKRGQYAPDHALRLALRHTHSLKALRCRHEKRKERQQQNQQRAARSSERMLRFATALAFHRLPASLMYSTHIGLRYRLSVSWASDSYMNLLLDLCVQALCKHHYLMHYTVFQKVLQQHINEFGDADDAAAVVAAQFKMPETWPWL